MRRREFLTFFAGLTTWPFELQAEQAAIPAVGFLSSLSAAALTGPVAAFQNGLHSVGYTEGKTVEIEFRWAEGHYDRLSALAADLVKRQVAVIVTVGGDPPAFAAKAASTTIPIVFMVGRDPVELGLVRSLNQPGGNATGINLQISEIESKRIELLRQLAPTRNVLAVLINPKNADADVQLKVVQSAAHALNEQIKIFNVSTEGELEETFASVYAGKILSGVMPSDLPVVQPTKFDLVINLKTARALGLNVPPLLLALADEVIE